MKILVIGSKGFVGLNTFNYFNNGNNEVWGADILESDDKNYFRLERQNTSYEPIFEAHKFDVCINASGNGSVPISLNLPVFDFELNVTNTLKVLDAIRLNNPQCKYISLSSAAVYGNPAIMPVTEDSPLKPLSPYGWHKLYTEYLCKEYYYLYNLQTINLRLFSVYGEHLRKQLFWDTYQKSLRSKTVELFGSGNETRDFIYIQDLNRALDCVIQRGLFNGEAVNVGSGVETAINEAAAIFCKAIDQNIKLKFNQLVKPGDPLNWKSDISILKSFGFEPQVSIEEGLTNTAQWMKENA
ncbi:NAD-dependent epimerase/dehydratase family protein [Mucilaginibacter ximonensis]|uniref:NAD-dependent epimerase/dehydratase family protein n=1 Tax=Mucilaginibacter ximonensis TaxID=538021 RepID=A0ABW5YF37_9SPHI